MLPQAGIEPASPRLLVGRDDHYTIVLIPCRDLEAMKHTYVSKRKTSHGMALVRSCPLRKVATLPPRNRGDAGSIPARGNMFFFSHEVCVESQTAQLFTVRYLFVFVL